MSPPRASVAAQIRDAAPLFAALGDETRLAVLLRLASGGPGSISHLSAKASVSRQAIKKHLDVLEDAGLVRGIRQGREHIWQLETRRLVDAQTYLGKISAQWDDVLERLRNFVENDE
ncbi:MAG TPA: metalloregulator ArsR/SmtB family transcription factor [Polyangiaceae bacterium]|jgi:DNA-binding transcriptional ArsR family regulator|nr:metalloregulator ArsR/SmtB family transcription factor [Polyangiaceae bacterium]